MNGYERIQAALAGRWPDRPPVMLHNFMPAAREAGYTMGQYRKDPKKIAESFIRAVETYGYDGVLVDVDTATLAEAVGVPVDHPEDEPARCEGGCLEDLACVKDLLPPDIRRCPRVQIWLEAVRLLKAHFGDEVYLRGNCDQCPFSLASMMRTPTAWMMDLLDKDNRESVFRLLDYCAEATVQFVRLMTATGAHMISNGDSPASMDLISPAMYRIFAWPWEQKVVDQTHALGKAYVLHICGNVTGILGDMLALGAEGLDLDYKTDMRKAHDLMKDRAVFIGNLDPSGVLALGSPSLVEWKTRELLEIFADTPRFILNSGCALPATTPPENLRTMIRVARSSYDDQ
jgi:MtaA/CmuA family methyltransferase